MSDQQSFSYKGTGLSTKLGLMCLAEVHNTVMLMLEPVAPRSGVKHSTTEPLIACAQKPKVLQFVMECIKTQPFNLTNLNAIFINHILHMNLEARKSGCCM